MKNTFVFVFKLYFVHWQSFVDISFTFGNYTHPVPRTENEFKYSNL